MKPRPFISTLALASVVFLVASTATHAAYVRRATVNADNSVTIEWELESTDVSNLSVAVDCCVVHGWPGVDRSTTFTTTPLSAGEHTIAIQVEQRIWTNTNFGTNCVLSTRPSYVWVCYLRTWTARLRIRVPSAAQAVCVVPSLAGLRLDAARARIRVANCSLGTLRRRTSDRPPGTVLAQLPKPNKRLPTGRAITLVVSAAR